MQPNHQKIYQVKCEDPYAVTNHDIKIEEVSGKRGVWIIELEGEGISSRFFLRKGAIGHYIDYTEIGAELTFFDESGNKVKDFSIWMEGKKHTVNDKFSIPYGENSKSLNLILTKEQYAEKISVRVPMEEYKLRVGYIYGAESFLVGTKAKVILHPMLSLSSNRANTVSLGLLSKTKITVQMMNAQGTPTSLTFDNVRFRDDQDYLLEFPVQSYVSSVNITV